MKTVLVGVEKGKENGSLRPSSLWLTNLVPIPIRPNAQTVVNLIATRDSRKILAIISYPAGAM